MILETVKIGIIKTAYIYAVPILIVILILTSNMSELLKLISMYGFFYWLIVLDSLSKPNIKV